MGEVGRVPGACGWIFMCNFVGCSCGTPFHERRPKGCHRTSPLASLLLQQYGFNPQQLKPFSDKLTTKDIKMVHSSPRYLLALVYGVEVFHISFVTCGRNCITSCAVVCTCISPPISQNSSTATPR